MSEKEEALTTQEVADRYKISKQSQQIYRDKGTLPFMKVGKRVLYNKIQFDMWLRQFSVNEVAVEETLED